MENEKRGGRVQHNRAKDPDAPVEEREVSTMRACEAAESSETEIEGRGGGVWQQHTKGVRGRRTNRRTC